MTVDGLQLVESDAGANDTCQLALRRHKSDRDTNMVPNTANSVYKSQRQLFARSERVKGIDFHPVEPWILTTLYSGMWYGAPPCASY